MSKVKLQITVPARLSDITLDQYQRYVKVLKGIDPEGENASEFLNMKALDIFCGLELKESYKLPISTFDSVIEKIANCLNEDTPLVKRFWFRGSNGVEVEFGMNPDLNNLTTGEYVDLDRYISDFETLHNAMAVLYRPITASKGDFYEIEDYEASSKYADYMKYMPVSVALGAYVFFYRLGMKLSSLTMDSSLKQMSKEQLSQVEKKFSQVSGAGISHFTHSLEVISSSLTKLPSNLYTQV
jgi:hypothetical protein